jgi:hypothetical protein
MGMREGLLGTACARCVLTVREDGRGLVRYTFKVKGKLGDDLTDTSWLVIVRYCAATWR